MTLTVLEKHSREIFFFTALVVLIILAWHAMAQSFGVPTRAENISCGNNVCEEMIYNLRVGEEKNITVNDQTYRFKLDRIEAKPMNTIKVTDPQGIERDEIIYSYDVFLSVNGGAPALADEIKKQLNLKFEAGASYTETEREQPKEIFLSFTEANVCAIPDCASVVQIPVYKKWNLVPLYFLAALVQDTSGSSGGFESYEGTCKLQDIAVAYGYNVITHKYVRLYAMGMDPDSFDDELQEFNQDSESQGVFFLMPFSSVWVYSNSECELKATIPKLITDQMLFFLSALAEQWRESHPGSDLNVGFASGWNFWIGSNDLASKSWDEVRGNCIIEKAYSFDASGQSWQKLDNPSGPNVPFVFEVQGPCLFGFPEIAPPSLPTGEIVRYPFRER